MLMNCERMQNSRLSYRKRNTRQSPTSLGIITRSMLRDGCELHKWSSTREISGRPRTTKKSNDVFENVASAANVSDYDLYARETRLEATGRPFTNCATDFGRHYSHCNSVKRALTWTMKSYTHAVFVGVETLLNSRPLTTLTTNVNDEPVLTPNGFIVGQLGDKWIHKESRSNVLVVKISFVPYLDPFHLTPI